MLAVGPAMAALARFLPLFLVVTCLVLQTLQVVYGQRDHGELTMLQMQKQEQEDAIESNYSGKKRKRSAVSSYCMNIGKYCNSMFMLAMC